MVRANKNNVSFLLFSNFAIGKFSQLCVSLIFSHQSLIPLSQLSFWSIEFGEPFVIVKSYEDIFLLDEIKPRPAETICQSNSIVFSIFLNTWEAGLRKRTM